MKSCFSVHRVAEFQGWAQHALRAPFAMPPRAQRQKSKKARGFYVLGEYVKTMCILSYLAARAVGAQKGAHRQPPWLHPAPPLAIPPVQRRRPAAGRGVLGYLPIANRGV